MYKRVVCIVFLPIFAASNHPNNINYQLSNLCLKNYSYPHS